MWSLCFSECFTYWHVKGAWGSDTKCHLIKVVIEGRGRITCKKMYIGKEEWF